MSRTPESVDPAPDLQGPHLGGWHAALDLWDTLPGFYVLRVLDDYARHGVNLRGTLAEFGIDAVNLRNDSALDHRCVTEWTEHVLERHPQRGLGLSFGSALQLPDLGLVGYAVLSSPTFGDGVTQWLRYGTLMRPYLGTRREPCDAHGFQLVAVERDPAPCGPRLRLYCLERWAAAWVQLARAQMGAGHHVEQVEFSYPDPGFRDAYYELFGGRMMFSRPRTLIRFAPHVASAITRHANASASAMCASQCAALVERENRGRGTSAAVRRWLLDRGSPYPDARATAARMQLSESTLRRRLQDEGTSFSELLHRLRMRLAEDHLRHGRLGVGEIALRLDFADESAFTRAFKRDHAITPLAYRRAGGRPIRSTTPGP